MAVHELQHLALGDGVGGIGEHLHHAHVVDFDHHLEGARVEEIADQHRGGVAERGVGGRAAAAQVGCVDHVVVQQRGGVDELDHRGELRGGCLAAVAQRRRAASSSSAGRRRLPPPATMYSRDLPHQRARPESERGVRISGVDAAPGPAGDRAPAWTRKLMITLIIPGPFALRKSIGSRSERSTMYAVIKTGGKQYRVDPANS